MYAKCITCDHIDGCPHSPRFYQMSPEDVLDWCRKRIKHRGLTFRQVALGSGVPEGTITRLFAEKSPYADYKHTTIQPVLRFLCGDSLGEPPCPEPDKLKQTLDATVQERDDLLRRLEAESAHHKAELVALRGENERKLAHLNKEIDDYREELNFNRQQIRAAHRGRVIMTAICVVLLLLISTALVIDRLNPDIGFFWVDRLKAAFNGVVHGNSSTGIGNIAL